MAYVGLPSCRLRSRADAPKEWPDRLRELLGMVEIRKVRSGRRCDLDAELLGEPSGGFREERVALPAYEKLDRDGDRGKRPLVGR